MESDILESHLNQKTWQEADPTVGLTPLSV